MPNHEAAVSRAADTAAVRLLTLDDRRISPALPSASPSRPGSCTSIQRHLSAYPRHRGWPGFTLTADNAVDIAAICGRLDGLPLAIELAASRVKLFTPNALLARLGQSLGLVLAIPGGLCASRRCGTPWRGAMTCWPPDVARVFRRMSVFAGGCDLNALAAVAVTEGADGGPRLGMLETIRQYALERLGQAGDLDDTRRRHAEYYAEFAERVGGQLRGPAHLTSLDRLEAEHDNLRAALAWSLNIPAPGSAGDGERAVTGLRLVQALGPFCTGTATPPKEDGGWNGRSPWHPIRREHHWRRSHTGLARWCCSRASPTPRSGSSSAAWPSGAT